MKQIDKDFIIGFTLSMLVMLTLYVVVWVFA